MSLFCCPRFLLHISNGKKSAVKNLSGIASTQPKTTLPEPIPGPENLFQNNRQAVSRAHIASQVPLVDGRALHQQLQFTPRQISLNQHVQEAERVIADLKTRQVMLEQEVARLTKRCYQLQNRAAPLMIRSWLEAAVRKLCDLPQERHCYGISKLLNDVINPMRWHETPVKGKPLVTWHQYRAEVDVSWEQVKSVQPKDWLALRASWYSTLSRKIHNTDPADIVPISAFNSPAELIIFDSLMKISGQKVKIE